MFLPLPTAFYHHTWIFNQWVYHDHAVHWSCVYAAHAARARGGTAYVCEASLYNRVLRCTFDNVALINTAYTFSIARQTRSGTCVLLLLYNKVNWENVWERTYSYVYNIMHRALQSLMRWRRMENCGWRVLFWSNFWFGKHTCVFDAATHSPIV